MDPPALTAALRAVIDAKGTDLVLSAGEPPLVRVDGALAAVSDLPAIDDDGIAGMLEALVSADLRAQLDRDRDIDFAFTRDDVRFRGNAFFQRGRLGIALRRLHDTIPTCEELGLPPVVGDMVTKKQGLILFTGPTGSGKSTSMAALIGRVNGMRPCHIITIEDPIEYVHSNEQAVIHQREVGIDALSFERALRAALREDPDIVLVGEMRDPETIAIALTLAETGHLVLSSLHTNDAPQALDRIVDVFPAERQAQVRLQLASTLVAVVAQRLLPATTGGMVAAFEVMVATSAVSNLIREGKTRQLRNAMQMGMAAGNRTMEMALNELLASGAITQETATAAAFIASEVDPTRAS
jgi:twitching motility protein PilT